MLTHEDTWLDRLRSVLERYDEDLLRRIAQKLVKPRSIWPVEDLLDRCLATYTNAPVLDRRLREVSADARRVLALLARSRQPRWPLGALIMNSLALGATEPWAPFLELFESGLLLPDLLPDCKPLQDFTDWFAGAGNFARQSVFTHPFLAARAADENLDLPDLSCDAAALSQAPPQEADGYEFLLRLSLLWQMVKASPIRRTLGGDFFKRDQERLVQHPVFGQAPADSLCELPTLPFFVIALAEAWGLVRLDDNQFVVQPLPTCWQGSYAELLQELWQVLPLLVSWCPITGWRDEEQKKLGGPFPSVYLLLFLLLARLPEHAWTSPAALEAWLWEHHPYWRTDDGLSNTNRHQPWVETFLLGIAFQLRLVEVCKQGEAPFVRLTGWGRWLAGVQEQPPAAPTFPRTLLVQPNLEIIVYRQGLTPDLLAKLTLFAAWKSFGSACILQLEPDSIYRALEAGLTHAQIVQTLEQHGTRATPGPVLEALRTWSNKRERIVLYPLGALLEFNSAADLEDALSRGLAATRLTDTLAVVASEECIDYRHFRLTGTRDYTMPPEPCVLVASDGVTLEIDPLRSDLLLETELPRFAEALPDTVIGKKRYQLTPRSMAAAKESGMNLARLELWFKQRTGQPLSPTARLFLTADEQPGTVLEKLLVLQLPTSELADGLLQWPSTATLLQGRLGPTALIVPSENVSRLQQVCASLGLKVQVREE